MIGEAELVTRRSAGGATAFATLRATAPLALRPTPDGVYVVSSAAAPLDGDAITLRIDVAPHTELTVRTAAASMAWPSRIDRPSRFNVIARIGAGAVLRWLPEQLVPIAGCRHEMRCDVDLAGGGSVIWREEIVLGRSGERPGDLRAGLDIVSERVPLLRQELAVGPAASGYDGPAVAGHSRALGTVTVAGAVAPAELPSGTSAPAASSEFALMALEHGGWQAAAVTDSAPRLRKLLDEGLHALLAPAPVPRTPELIADAR